VRVRQIDLLLEGAGRRVGVTNQRPLRRLAAVTCMDVRIDVLGVLGLEPGEANILRNAGGRVTEDVLRSLAVASHVLGVNAVVVMHHTGCGLEGESDASLQARTGADLRFLPIHDHGEALREDVGLLASTNYLGPLTTVAGWLYELETGRVAEIARWERSKGR